MYYNGFYIFFPADLFTLALKASMFRISAWVGNGVCTWVCTFYYLLFPLFVHRKVSCMPGAY